MTLITSNADISNSTITSELTVGTILSIESTNVAVGAVLSNSSQISVSNTVINSSIISTNSITLGTDNTSNTDFGVTGPFTWGGLTNLPLSFGAVVNTQTFIANGTWTNPISNATLGLTGNEQVFIMMWGGGGGGNSTANGLGGGGGACYMDSFPLSYCNGVCNVVVGLGGANNTQGGNTIFYANVAAGYVLTAFGGGGANSTVSGGGGGVHSAGVGGQGGNPAGANIIPTWDGIVTTGNKLLSGSFEGYFGGAGGYSTVNTTASWTWYINDLYGRATAFGGQQGAVGKLDTNGFTPSPWGHTIYGGAGGDANNSAQSTSFFGGAADANMANSSYYNPPGMGGGMVYGTATLVNGQRGEVRIWVIK